jgi:hypothetical protein
LTQTALRDTLKMRCRAHPVRGEGRAHLSNAVIKPSIFFQPDVRTRAP